jgi:purine-binding chemotaxis protein CheW
VSEATLPAGVPPRDPDALLQAAEARRASLARGDEAEREAQLIHFALGSGRYAVPLENVVKIERVPRVVPVPRTPAFVRGLVSLRGEIVCVIDLRDLLGLGSSAAAPRGIVVLQDGARRIGLLGDSLPDFLRIRADAIVPPPAGLGSDALAGVVERDGKTIAVLDTVRLLDLIGSRVA